MIYFGLASAMLLSFSLGYAMGVEDFIAKRKRLGDGKSDE